MVKLKKKYPPSLNFAFSIIQTNIEETETIITGKCEVYVDASNTKMTAIDKRNDTS